MSGPPSAWVRRGGTTSPVPGERLVWAVADGGRGRRWRETATRDGVMVRAVLLETDPAGRCTHLELATARGLLTLHPASDDRELHGNVVTADGVRPLAFAWSADRDIFVVGSPASAAIILRRRVVASGSVPVLRIDDDLDPRPADLDLAILGPLDADGLAYRGTGAGWPLERDDAPGRG